MTDKTKLKNRVPDWWAEDSPDGWVACYLSGPGRRAGSVDALYQDEQTALRAARAEWRKCHGRKR